jgi:hypothetical protein
MDQFMEGYMLAALWASTDGNDKPLDGREIHPATLALMAEDCKDFQDQNAALLAAWYSWCQTPESAGHDFWLTRNHHGTGFWDRFHVSTAEGQTGRHLTNAAHAYGSFDLYLGDDGMVHGI